MVAGSAIDFCENRSAGDPPAPPPVPRLTQTDPSATTMHSGWRSSGRRLLATGLVGLGGLGIAASISPGGVVDAIDE